MRGDEEGGTGAIADRPATFPAVMASAARRREDPLIKTFMAAAQTAWPTVPAVDDTATASSES